MIDVEGIVSNVPGARALGGGMMTLHFTLSPWRYRDSNVNEPGSAVVTIETDLDYVDAWMRDLDPGACVRVVCSSLSAPDADGNVHIQCYREPLSSCPDGWAGPGSG